MRVLYTPMPFYYIYAYRACSTYSGNNNDNIPYRFKKHFHSMPIKKKGYANHDVIMKGTIMAWSLLRNER